MNKAKGWVKQSSDGNSRATKCGNQEPVSLIDWAD